MEQAVLMLLYVLHKRHFFILILVLLTLFSVCLLVNKYGADKYEYTEKHFNVTEYQDGDTYNLTTRLTSVYNQHLCITLQLHTDYADDGDFDKKFDTVTTVYGIEGDLEVQLEVKRKETVTLHCSSKSCQPIAMLHITAPIRYSRYRVYVTLERLANLPYSIDAISFKTFRINAAYTNFEICFRFFYLFISFVVLVVFSRKMKIFLIRDWSIEQRCMSFLLPLLLLFNNPFYPICYLGSSNVQLTGSLVNAVFERTFVCALLMFWLVIYDGIRKRNHEFKPFILGKLLLLTAVYAAMISLTTCEVITPDPVAGHIHNFRLITSCVQVSLLVYFCYLAYLILKSFQEVSSLAYFDLRLKVFTIAMTILLAIIAVLEFYHKHDDETIEIAEHGTTSLLKRGSYFLYASVFNLYVYALTYIYSPAPNASFESQFKDNPTFSMLNNSDDDIEYGSEDEHFNVNAL